MSESLENMGISEMQALLQENQTVWQRLQEEKRPIILYGMGDGAQKILNVFADFGIVISDIFASDEFVRGHSFAGIRVKKLSEIQALYSDFIIVIGFASQRPEVLEKFYQLDDQYDVVAPDVPVAGGGLFDLDFYKAHQEEILRAYRLWADERSRQIYWATLNYKISGKLRYLREFTDAKEDAFTQLLKPGKNEHFLDLGAYNGDTIRELLSYTEGSYASITALEPDEKNFKKLASYEEENLTGSVKLVHGAAWNREETLEFSVRAGRNSALGCRKGKRVPGVTVDGVLQGAPVTMMKLDVEGSEKQVLEGAKETMCRFKPKLNLALYHRNEDLFALPLQVEGMCPGYAFYLRHHPYVPSWDTNLYGIHPKMEGSICY